MLYWLDDGGVGVPVKIAAVNMDGNNSHILLKDGLNNLEALTLDLFHKRLYWSQRFDGAVSNSLLVFINFFNKFDYYQLYVIIVLNIEYFKI